MNATGISHHMHRGISLFPTGDVAGQEAGKISGRYAGCLLSRALLCTAQVLTGARATKTESVAAGMLRSHLPELCSVIREDETKSQKRKEDETV